MHVKVEPRKQVKVEFVGINLFPSLSQIRSNCLFGVGLWWLVTNPNISRISSLMLSLYLVNL